MGLEVRRVAADWEPPTQTGNYTEVREELAYRPELSYECWRPHHDQDWLSAWRAWQRRRVRWYAARPFIWLWTVLGLPGHMKRYGWPRWATYQSGEEEDGFRGYYGQEPEWYDHRPRWKDSERTRLQLYETVSEGTPLSPPMPDADALAVWLAEHTVGLWNGTDQMDYNDWVRFLEAGGWAMSFVVSPEHGVESGVEHAVRTAKVPDSPDDPAYGERVR